MAGDRGDDLSGAAPSGAKRSDLQDRQFVKRAVFCVPAKDNKARDPWARDRALVNTTAGNAGLTVLREGWLPVWVETLGL